MPVSTQTWIILLVLRFLRDQVQGVPCGYPGSSQNGRPNRVQEYYSEGEAVTYTCDQGYFLMGPSSRKCTANGTWTPPRIPLCDSHLENLDETTTASSSKALEEYPPRLAIDGDTSTCSYTGRTLPRWWRLDLEHTHKILSVAITVADPQLEQNLGVSILELNGNSATYQRCAFFTGKFASSSLVLRCGGGGTGGDEGITGRILHIEDNRKDLTYFGLCEVAVFVLKDRYSCGQPERPVNSYIVRLKPDQIEYRCVAGHKLVGNRRRQCLTSGQWSGHQPICLEVRCAAPEPIANGDVRVRATGLLSGGQHAVLGSIAVYTCDHGFGLRAAPRSGTNGSRICNEDGNWSPAQPPVCLPVNCDHPSVPDNFPDGTTFRLLNDSHTGHGATARLLCPDGYEPSSGHEDLVRCKGDGTWTNPRLKCLSGDHVASSPVEAAREEPGTVVTVGLVLGLVGTVLLLTMVLAILCLILKRRRHIKSRSSEANGSSRSSGSLQALYNGPTGVGAEFLGPPQQEGVYSAPIQPARPVVSVIYDYPRRAVPPIAVTYPFTIIAVDACPSRTPSKENIYEEIALNGNGTRTKTGSKGGGSVRITPPKSPPKDPKVLALYAQVDFEKKRLSRQMRDSLSGGSSPSSPAHSPASPREERQLPPVPPDAIVQNDVSGDDVILQNGLSLDDIILQNALSCDEIILQNARSCDDIIQQNALSGDDVTLQNALSGDGVITNDNEPCS